MILVTGCQVPKVSTVTDPEGNQYNTRTYGQSVWMTENLRSKKDRSGASIKYHFPNEDSANVQAFGLLYDYETACRVCPDGWRLPTNEEWEVLFDFNRHNDASTYKEPGFWEGEDNTNSSAFSVRPAGAGNTEVHPNHFETRALFWSDTKEDEHFIWTYILELGRDSVRSASQHPTYAFSVRCIKATD